MFQFCHPTNWVIITWMLLNFTARCWKHCTSPPVLSQTISGCLHLRQNGMSGNRNAERSSGRWRLFIIPLDGSTGNRLAIIQFYELPEHVIRFKAPPPKHPTRHKKTHTSFTTNNISDYCNVKWKDNDLTDVVTLRRNLLPPFSGKNMSTIPWRRKQKFHSICWYQSTTLNVTCRR
jgi:hypothetical protein